MTIQIIIELYISDFPVDPTIKNSLLYVIKNINCRMFLS